MQNCRKGFFLLIIDWDMAMSVVVCFQSTSMCVSTVWELNLIDVSLF